MVAVGDRVRLDAMPNDPNPVPPGSKGTVTHVAPTQIIVEWDSGRSLMLLPDVDRFTVVASQWAISTAGGTVTGPHAFVEAVGQMLDALEPPVPHRLIPPMEG